MFFSSSFLFLFFFFFFHIFLSPYFFFSCFLLYIWAWIVLFVYSYGVFLLFCEFTCKPSEILSSPFFFLSSKTLLTSIYPVLTYCSISNVLGMCGILCISSYRSNGQGVIFILFSFFSFSFIYNSVPRFAFS